MAVLFVVIIVVVQVCFVLFLDERCLDVDALRGLMGRARVGIWLVRSSGNKRTRQFTYAIDGTKTEGVWPGDKTHCTSTSSSSPGFSLYAGSDLVDIWLGVRLEFKECEYSIPSHQQAGYDVKQSTYLVRRGRRPAGVAAVVLAVVTFVEDGFAAIIAAASTTRLGVWANWPFRIRWIVSAASPTKSTPAITPAMICGRNASKIHY